MRLIIVFLLALLFPVASFADLKWSNGNSTSPLYSTWQDACSAASKQYWGTADPVIGFKPNSTDDFVYCLYQRSGYPNGYYNNDLFARRRGDCPVGSTWDSQLKRCLQPNGQVCGPKSPVTGLPMIKNAADDCVSFINADKGSQCKYAQNSVREVSLDVQFDSQGVPHGPPDASFAGCAAVPVGANPYKNCKQPASRQACYNGVCIEMKQTTAKCLVAVQFTGATADGQFGFTGNPDDGVGPCDPDTDCTPNTPPVENDRQPCTYQTDAEGRQSCTSFDYKGVPGETSSCGQVNGQMVCVAKKPPTSNGVQIDTKVETKNNPNGTTTTTKTDTRTDVKCIGAGSCTTQTTKTTTVTIKDSAGNTVGSETKCEGAKCSTSEGKGDGSGTGEGECTVDCEEEGENLKAPELGDVPTFSESLNTFMEGVQGTPLVSAVSGIGLPSGGTCSMGSTNTAIGTISLDYICTNSNWLDPLYFVFLAIWAFAAVRVLMSA